MHGIYWAVLNLIAISVAFSAFFVVGILVTDWIDQRQQKKTRGNGHGPIKSYADSRGRKFYIVR